MKRILTVLFAVIINFITASGCAFAENFYIDNYDIRMNVTENRVVQVQEDIDVVFFNSSHGIFRNIPLKSKIVRADGSNELSRATIKNISVSETYTKTTNSNGDCVLKIGSPDKYINGRHKYSISYNLYLGNDKLKNNDEFYFNIIGTQWPVEIKNASFFIKMPKEFSADNIGLSIGRYGIAGFDNDAEFYSDGKYIQGVTKRQLNPNEGITIRVLLPDNYFIKNNNELNESTLFIITLFGIIILTFIAFIIWYKYGKDEPVTPIVNFYPPKGRNSAEVGVEFRGEACEKDIVSLIFFLASQGYIKIEDHERSFTLHKQKEYTGKNSIEKRLMNALFENGDMISKESLEISRTFYKSCKSMVKSLNNIKNFIFDKDACSWEKIVISLVCIIGIVALTLFALGDYSFSIINTMFNTGLIFHIGFIIFIILFIVMKFSSMSKTPVNIIFTIMFGIIFPVTMLFGTADIIKSQISSAINPVILATGIIGLIISLICLANMPKRNKSGRLALGNILGFKKFLEVAEKRRIETLMEKDKNYCFDILAFAYVLDVADKWIKNFSGIIKEPPSWYYSPYDFNMRSFNRISRALENSAIPSTANGGIKRTSSMGGGGFSGGGFGGGGGGSW